MKFITIIFVCFGSVLTLIGQNENLLICTTKADARLPFYTIEKMTYSKGNTYYEPTLKSPEIQSYKGVPYMALETGEMFFLLDGEFLGEGEAGGSIMKQFDIYTYQKFFPPHMRARTFQIRLREKNWEEQKDTLKKELDKALQKLFPSYGLNVRILEEKRDALMYIIVQLYSSTGGDEFETSTARKERLDAMKIKVEPHLRHLVSQLHTQRLWKIQQTIIEPYRKKLRAKSTPQKLHRFTFDIVSLGKYEADKEQFLDIRCSDGTSFKHMGCPIEQAKLLRANPQEYQLLFYIFEGQMSSPVNPLKDLSAFGHYELVHKETQKLVARTYAYFNQSYSRRYYRYTLNIPRY